jgi:hypothetical protein
MSQAKKQTRWAGSREIHDPAVANAERATTLRRNDLRRRARAQGFELRHSDYGYSLIDGGRQRVDGRSNLTLEEVAKHLGG